MRAEGHLDPKEFLKTVTDARDFPIEDLDKAERVFDATSRREMTLSSLEVWEQQQNSERRLRERFAGRILRLTWIQLGLINLFVLASGLSLLKLDPSILKTLILSVFGELAALLLVMARFLFPIPKGRPASLPRRRERR